jgi:hypothetical protein
VPGRLDIERSIRRTFALFASTAGTVVPTVLVLYLPYIVTGMITQAVGESHSRSLFDPDPSTFTLQVVEWLLGLVLGAAATAAVTWTCASALAGDRTSVGRAIPAGLALTPVVLGISILWSFLGFVGLLLLIVPGLVVTAMFWVAIPAAVVEGIGIVDAFERSRALTHGHRLRLLGTVLLFMLLVILPAVLVVAVPSAVLALIGGPVALGLAALFSGVVTAVLSAMGATLSLVLYDELVSTGSSISEGVGGSPSEPGEMGDRP